MRIAKYTLGLVLCIFCFAVPVGAIPVTVIEPPDPIEYSPVFITGFQMTNQLDVIELYNDSSDPIDLSSWSIQYASSTPDEVCKIAFQDWLIPGGYVVVSANGSLPADSENVLFYDSCPRSLAEDFNFVLEKEDLIQETITPTFTPTLNAFVRKGLTKTYRTGKFSTDFIAINRSLYAGEWYIPPEALQIQFSEILINARNCSPLETTLDCADYVKIYNPTDQPIDLSFYRLRNGYLGQTPSSSNTTLLDGILESGHYIVLPVTITNSANWVWVEDMYGVKKYDNTVTEYPDGSSDTKKGQAWAYDVSDGNWKWTTQPTPSDAPSVFPAPVVEQVAVPIVTTTETLVPCKDGQYRSEETNRCRNIEVATVLVPCAEGQERNPETNRCRSVTAEVLGASTLTPCKEGQERNPETNRCRNITSTIPEVDYAPEKTTESSKNYILWWSLAGVGVVAISYAIWEWRYEIKKVILKLGSFIKSNK